ncbi:MAG: rhodanese-like domain-containing protein [Methylococcales bacterium]
MNHQPQRLISLALPFFLFLVFLYMTGCASNSQTHISQHDLLQQIKTHQAPTIIDVRSESEYQSGHVPGAIHIPFWAAFSRTDDVPSPVEKPLVLYCEHGPRAGIAKLAFSLGGYDNILYLEGHMSGWKKAKLPMEKPPVAK